MPVPGNGRAVDCGLSGTPTSVLLVIYADTGGTACGASDRTPLKKEQGIW